MQTHRLFLFHLLEFCGIEFDIDIQGLNERWADPDNIDSWSQLVIKHVEDNVDYITAAPESGIMATTGRWFGHIHAIRLPSTRSGRRAARVLSAHQR